MKILAIDPGAITGYAMLNNNGQVHRAGVFKVQKIADIERFIKDAYKYIAHTAGYRTEWALAIETQYYHMNIKTFEKLLFIRFAFETFSILHGATGIYRVNPSSWQKWIGVQAAMKRAEIKKLSREHAKRYAETIFSDNQADAINIARFVWDNYAKLPFFTKESLL